MKASELEKEFQSVSKYYDFQWDDGGKEGQNYMSWATRDNGNVGLEEVGQQDIDNAQEIIKTMRSKSLPIKWSMDTCDEWVNINAELTNGNTFNS